MLDLKSSCVAISSDTMMSLKIMFHVLSVLNPQRFRYGCAMADRDASVRTLSVLSESCLPMFLIQDNGTLLPVWRDKRIQRSHLRPTVVIRIIRIRPTCASLADLWPCALPSWWLQSMAYRVDELGRTLDVVWLWARFTHGTPSFLHRPTGAARRNDSAATRSQHRSSGGLPGSALL
jgi:hypothetical protein